MSDYNLQGLNNRDFEHLIQALAIKVIGPGITPFGDGPDGGREATFCGKMSYPSATAPWNGYLVIQCKFLTRPSGVPKKDGDWVLQQLKIDLDKFTTAKRQLKKPDYYLFVTNAVLTPASKRGTKDKIYTLLESYRKELGLIGYDVWDYDKLCRLLDGQPEICRKYAGFITAGDVLSEIIKSVDGMKPDFALIMSRFLQSELRADQFVKLEQAGQTADQKTLLAQVFIDLPVTDRLLNDPLEKEQDPNKLAPGFVAEVLEAGAQVLKGSVTSAMDMPSRRLNIPATLQPGRFVVVGGPGQGKSTLGQFICQLHRAAILRDRPTHSLIMEATTTLNHIQQQCQACGVDLPAARRFPVRIVLDQFANDLATGKINSLLAYLVRRIKTLTDYECSVTDLRRWLGAYPWLIVLDGLDEVPPTSNRAEVISKITDFWTEVATLDADVLVIATTRPQGYNEDFSPHYYQHRYLAPLSKTRALLYAERLAATRFGAEPDRKGRVLNRLATALEQPTTSRLMQTPLQVTIMATLVDQIGQPPQERWRLFQQYYEVIYRRETERDIQASRVLQQRRAEVNAIHNRVGLLLQSESERAGKTESRLSAERFSNLVRAHITEEGFEDEEIESRVREITDAATQRLVFLVGLEQDRIGFEIRSLQEFTAAEALMDGGDEQVQKRLEAIAPSVHWRNVFLFAVGKCFAERQFLRNMIIGICEQLNDEENDSLAGATLAGSRLALDILEDGVAREQPKFARRLANLALRLMDLPGSHANQRLGRSYVSSLDARFKEYITERLQRRDLDQKLGAWVVLLDLASQGVEWAVKLVETEWPTDTEQQLRILRSNGDNLREFVVQRVIELIPQITPINFLVLTRSSASIDWQTRSDLPDWFRSLMNFQTFAAHRVADEPIAVGLRISKGKKSKPFIYQYPFKQSVLIPMASMPIANPAWAPFLSAARFARKPNAETLANELRWLSKVWVPDESRLFMNDSIGWPLLACISRCKTQDELRALACRAQSGLLGDFNNWMSAEKRLGEMGITENDILYMTDDRWPYDASIDETGIPLASFSFMPWRANQSFVTQLFDIRKGLPIGSRVRTIISEWILHWLLLNENGKARGPKISIQDLKQLCIDTQIFHFNCNIAQKVDFPDLLDEAWIEFFDWLGGKIDDMHWLLERPLRQTSQIACAYVNRPTRKGLLVVLACLSLGGNRFKIPVEMISESNVETDNERLSALLIQLVQGNWGEAEAKNLANEFAILNTKLDGIWMAARILKVNSLKALDKEKFALALREQLQHVRSNELLWFVGFLEELMRQRKSNITNSTKWKECGLPSLP